MPWKSTICNALIYLVLFSGTVHPGTSQDPAGFFLSLAQSIRNKSLPDVMQHYDTSDFPWNQKMYYQYKDWLSREKDLEYLQEVLFLHQDGDSVSAVVYRQIQTISEGDTSLQPEWLEYILRRMKKGWKITAQSPWQFIETRFTHLEYYLFPENRRLEGTVTISLNILKDNIVILPFSLDRGLNITGLETTDGREIPFTRKGTTILARHPESLSGNTELELIFRVQGSFFDTIPLQGYALSAIRPEASFGSWLSLWYPQPEIPFRRAPGKLEFVVPDSFTVVANGDLVESSAESEGKQRFVFNVHTPSDFTFAMAPFFSWKDKADDLSIGVYFLQNNPDKAALYLENLKNILTFFKNDVYGFFPYEHFYLIELPDEVMGFTGGASEQGLSLFPGFSLSGSDFNLPVIAHEIGHCWWGNWVIGDGVLMSEGLANLGYALAVDHFWGEDHLHKMMKYGDFEYFQAAYLYFARIAGNPVKDLPVGIVRWDNPMTLHAVSNTKGYFAFFMLRDLLGETAFYEGLRHAAHHFAHQYMTLEELQASWEEASGRNLDAYFRQWFYQPGAPEISLDYDVTGSGDGFQLKGTIRQHTGPYIFELEIISQDKLQAVRNTIEISTDSTAFAFSLRFRPDTVLLDPDYKVFRLTDEFRHLDTFGAAFDTAFAREFETSEQLYLARLDKYPGDILTRCWLADLYFRILRDYDKALEQNRTILAAAGDHPEFEMYYPHIAMYSGRIYEMRGDLEKALELYRYARELDTVQRFSTSLQTYISQVESKR